MNPGISERRKLVQDHRKHRFIGISIARRLCVTLADHQLNVLEKDLSQGFDGALVTVGVERDKQDQIVFKNIVERQQILVGAGNDRQFVFEEAQKFVQESLNLLHTLAVCERTLRAF